MIETAVSLRDRALVDGALHRGGARLQRALVRHLLK